MLFKIQKQLKKNKHHLASKNVVYLHVQILLAIYIYINKNFTSDKKVYVQEVCDQGFVCCDDW